jgi:hypothetical protein
MRRGPTSEGGRPAPTSAAATSRSLAGPGTTGAGVVARSRATKGAPSVGPSLGTADGPPGGRRWTAGRLPASPPFGPWGGIARPAPTKAGHACGWSATPPRRAGSSARPRRLLGSGGGRGPSPGRGPSGPGVDRAPARRHARQGRAASAAGRRLPNNLGNDSGPTVPAPRRGASPSRAGRPASFAPAAGSGHRERVARPGVPSGPAPADGCTPATRAGASRRSRAPAPDRTGRCHRGWRPAGAGSGRPRTGGASAPSSPGLPARPIGNPATPAAKSPGHPAAVQAAQAATDDASRRSASARRRTMGRSPHPGPRRPGLGNDGAGRRAAAPRPRTGGRDGERGHAARARPARPG